MMSWEGDGVLSVNMSEYSKGRGKEIKEIKGTGGGCDVTNQN